MYFYILNFLSNVTQGPLRNLHRVLSDPTNLHRMSIMWVLWMFCDICSASSFGLVGRTTAAIQVKQVV